MNLRNLLEISESEYIFRTNIHFINLFASLGRSPSTAALLETAVELAAAVERDGGKVQRSGGKPVVMQLCGDLKYGFNNKRELAMAIWLSMPGLFRDDSVAVVVEAPPE